MSVEVLYDTLYSDVRKILESGKPHQRILSFSSYLTILNMDKVKYTLSGSVVNATFTFDDERVPALTVNLNDMSINDGDVLAKQLNDYGQEYKANCIARIPSQAVTGGQGMEFGFVDGVIVPIVPETPEVPVDPETPIDPE
jgi:hypothetical protein